MIHVLEALWGLWIAWLLRKALIAHYVRKRLCPACNGHGFVDQVMQVEPLVTRKHLPRVQTGGLRMNRKLAGWCLYHAAWPTRAGGIGQGVVFLAGTSLSLGWGRVVRGELV